MKFSLVHLSGSQRGETQYFDRPRLTLGSAPSNDIVFPADGSRRVAPVQAELYEEGCAIHLQNRAPDGGTLVNHKPVAETILNDKDLIQLGPHGPKLRFRIRVEEYAACKLVREILQDARDVAIEGRENGRGPLGTFLRQVGHDVRHHASRPTQLLIGTLMVLLVGIAGGAVFYTFLTQRAHEQELAALLKELESARQTQADLERRTAEERRRLTESLAAQQADTARLVALLEAERRHGASPEQVRALTQRLDTLEAGRRSAEALIKRYGAAVCFLHITFGFVKPGTAESAPAVLLESVGSGFLIDDQGLLVMNRHLAQPWTMDPSWNEMVKERLEPKSLRILAYIPGRAESHEVSILKISERGDVALGRLSPAPVGVTPIPVRKPAPQGIAGEAVVVLGYPVGVEGLLARMEEQSARALMKSADHDLGQLVQQLAIQGGIRPLATQGHVGDIVPGRVIYDAQTTAGSSGGPVFNSQGQVIAVNAARMIRFGGASFGVPIGQVLELLP